MTLSFCAYPILLTSEKVNVDIVNNDVIVFDIKSLLKDLTQVHQISSVC
jgi:hypothetical protein